MSERQDAERREQARMAALDRSKEVRRIDNEVARDFADGKSMRESAIRLGVSKKRVWASRVWQGLCTGKAWRAGETRTGEVRGSRASLQALMEGAS